MAQGDEDATRHLFARTAGMVRAGPPAFSRRAAKDVPIDHRVAAAAFRAPDETGDQMRRPAHRGEAVAGLVDVPGPDRALAPLDLDPDFVVGDPEVRPLLDDRPVLWIEVRDALAGLRVLREALPGSEPAAAVGLGLRPWVAGIAIWSLGHAAAVHAARKDRARLEALVRHVGCKGYLAC